MKNNKLYALAIMLLLVAVSAEAYALRGCRDTASVIDEALSETVEEKEGNEVAETKSRCRVEANRIEVKPGQKLYVSEQGCFGFAYPGDVEVDEEGDYYVSLRGTTTDLRMNIAYSGMDRPPFNETGHAVYTEYEGVEGLGGEIRQNDDLVQGKDFAVYEIESRTQVVGDNGERGWWKTYYMTPYWNNDGYTAWYTVYSDEEEELKMGEGTFLGIIQSMVIWK